jgi:hypothetical protein
MCSQPIPARSHPGNAHQDEGRVGGAGKAPGLRQCLFGQP